MANQPRNHVHKNMEKFNKPKTHTDKKRAEKSGSVKHKGKIDEV